jgi:hypothetical protein
MRGGPVVRVMRSVHVMPVSRILAAATMLSLAAACGDGGSAADEGLPPEISAAPMPPYEAMPLDTVGRIEGTIAWAGTIPPDSIANVPQPLVRVCRTNRLRLTPVRVTRGTVSGAVVWLADARRGKPLPASRRFELATDRCRLTPPVQSAIAGGMLNVLSLDRLEHRLLFTRAGTEGAVGRVEQFDAGQVVPLESVLRLPGPVTVSSDRYRWMTAWIHVFDHPYFAMSDRGGEFAIDSIPPGRYTLVLWHSAVGSRDTTITVTGGDTSRIRLVLQDASP